MASLEVKAQYPKTYDIREIFLKNAVTTQNQQTNDKLIRRAY